MELKLLRPDQLSRVYNRDLRRAFPAAEMKSLWLLRRLMDKGYYRPYACFEGDEIIGEAFLWTGRPGWAMLDYLCVVPGRRNDGLGQKIQLALREAEPGTVFVGEAEEPADAPDPGLAERRLGFYHRFGWRDSGYEADIFSAHYRCLYLADREIPPEELMEQHNFIYRTGLSPKQCRRFIRIPPEPGYQTPAR